MKNKAFKRILIGAAVVLLLIFATIFGAIIINNNKTNQVFDDYSSIYSNPKYQNSYYVDNLEPIKQDISCGYAVIEMFAKWSGNENITEKSLYDEYGAVVTSTGDSFEKEMNKQFKNYNTTMYKYLKNTELIDKIYDSLSSGIPVPFEWAARFEDEWTLHYSLVTGIDIENNLVTVLNPYGYKETISIDEFLERTSFRAYDNMPLFIKLGFAFGIFEKNTIFIVEPK
jgi:hypothetical protein